MTALDERLRGVLELLAARPGGDYADIGSDRAALPLAALRSGLFIIAVELHPGPLQAAQRAAQRAGLKLDVRQGDGFAPLSPQEVGSA